LGITFAKVGAFVATLLLIGPRVLPWLLRQVARTGSRELFTLGVLAVALGIGFGSAELFGVSYALGAFFAGMVLHESDLSHKTATNSLPLQDAFAVLFFVSVGVLFDPRAGDKADSVYFVCRGQVEVTVAGRRIKLGPGDFFGEMALISDLPRSADVTALDYCKLADARPARFPSIPEPVPGNPQSDRRRDRSAQGDESPTAEQGSLARMSHTLVAHLANHLAASGFVLPHHITLDMPWSSSPPGDQSITQI
jgi:hypothetical protein